MIKPEKNKTRWMIALFSMVIFAICGCMPLEPGTPATVTPRSTRIPTLRASATPDEFATLAADLKVSPGVLAGTELTFWHPLTGKSADVLNQMVNEFNQMNPYGIFVTPTSYYGEGDFLYAVENSLREGSSLPSLVAASPDQLNYWQRETGKILDLAPYFSDPSVGLTDQQVADLFPSFFPRETTPDARLGVPFYRSGSVLFYNQTWANELGFSDPPVTVEEFENQACAAAEANAGDKIRSNNGTGGWFIDTAWQSAVNWLKAFGFSKLEPGSGGNNFSFSVPDAEKTLLFLKKLNDKGCAWTGRKTDPLEYFSARQALFYSAALEDIDPQVKTNARLGSLDMWIPIAYPDQSGLGGVLSSGYDFGVFQADARSQMAAWLFIKWMMEPSRHARLVAADTTFPLSYSEIAALGTLGEDNLQWQQALGFISQVVEAPDSPDWWMVRRILEDAFWKSLQPNVTEADLPIILRELDATISEVLAR
jgi:ABC-type glycerol-3-phosphate transport system substrate-binding protein